MNASPHTWMLLALAACGCGTQVKVTPDSGALSPSSDAGEPTTKDSGLPASPRDGGTFQCANGLTCECGSPAGQTYACGSAAGSEFCQACSGDAGPACPGIAGITCNRATEYCDLILDGVNSYTWVTCLPLPAACGDVPSCACVENGFPCTDADGGVIVMPPNG